MPRTSKVLTGIGRGLEGVGQIMADYQDSKLNAQIKEAEKQEKAALERNRRSANFLATVKQIPDPKVAEYYLDLMSQMDEDTGFIIDPPNSAQIKSKMEEFSAQPISIGGMPAQDGTLFQPGSKAPVASMSPEFQGQVEESGLEFDLQRLFSMAGKEPTATVDQQRQDLTDQLQQVLQPLIASGITQQGIEQLMGGGDFLKTAVIDPVTKSRQAEAQKIALDDAIFEAKLKAVGEPSFAEEKKQAKEEGILSGIKDVAKQKYYKRLGYSPTLKQSEKNAVAAKAKRDLLQKADEFFKKNATEYGKTTITSINSVSDLEKAIEYIPPKVVKKEKLFGLDWLLADETELSDMLPSILGEINALGTTKWEEKTFGTPSKKPIVATSPTSAQYQVSDEEWGQLQVMDNGEMTAEQMKRFDIADKERQ